jgi:hypothetical protein
VNPPAASILRAEAVPPYGGDTTWSNLVAAYEGLSEPLRRLADGLRAEHRFLAGVDTDGADRYQDQINRNLLVAVHPVVRVHPETGERALFVNPGFTTKILGPSAAESRQIRTCSSPRSPGPPIRSGSAGVPVTSPSGTTGPPRTWPRRTSITSTSNARCIASR